MSEKKGGYGFLTLLGVGASVKVGVLAIKGLVVGTGVVGGSVAVSTDAAKLMGHASKAAPSVTRAARPMDDLLFGLSDDVALFYGDDALRATDPMHPPLRRPGTPVVTATDAHRIRRIGSDGVAYADLPSVDRIAVKAQRPARFRHYAAVPGDPGEFNAVFGLDAPMSGLKGTYQTRVRMEAIDHLTLASRADKTEDLMRFVDEADGDFVTFVGHNEDGHFRLPSGQSVDMAELSAHCAEVGTPCVFLSCSSARVVEGPLGAVGTQGGLTYDDAIAAMHDLERTMEGQALDQLSLHAVATILSDTVQTSISRSQYRARVRYVGKRIGTGTGIGGVSIGISELTNDTDDRKGKTK